MRSLVEAFGWNFPNTGLLASFDAARKALPELRSVEAMLAGLDRGSDGWVLTLSDGSTLAAPLA